MFGKLLARGGDATVGYEIWIDRALRLMHIRIRGFWQAPMGKAFLDAAVAGTKLMSSGGPWYLLADIRTYPPQQQSVQQCFAELLSTARGLGLGRAAYIVENAHGSMQFKRLATESGLAHIFATSEPEGLTWLGSVSR